MCFVYNLGAGLLGRSACLATLYNMDVDGYHEVCVSLHIQSTCMYIRIDIAVCFVRSMTMFVALVILLYVSSHSYRHV